MQCKNVPAKQPHEVLWGEGRSSFFQRELNIAYTGKCEQEAAAYRQVAAYQMRAVVVKGQNDFRWEIREERAHIKFAANLCLAFCKSESGCSFRVTVRPRLATVVIPRAPGLPAGPRPRTRPYVLG